MHIFCVRVEGSKIPDPKASGTARLEPGMCNRGGGVRGYFSGFQCRLMCPKIQKSYNEHKGHCIHLMPEDTRTDMTAFLGP